MVMANVVLSSEEASFLIVICMCLMAEIVVQDNALECRVYLLIGQWKDFGTREIISEEKNKLFFPAGLYSRLSND